MVLVCVAALIRGRWEEKVLGAVYLAACMASMAVEKRPWTGPQGGVIAIDAVVLGVSVAVVLGSEKLWPILAAAFQVLTVGAHLAFIGAEGRLGAAGYLTVLALWSYGTIACIAWGAGSQGRPVGLHLRDLRKGFGSADPARSSIGSMTHEPVARRCDESSLL